MSDIWAHDVYDKIYRLDRKLLGITLFSTRKTLEVGHDQQQFSTKDYA